MMTSAAEWSAIDLYRKLLSSKTGPFRTVEMSPNTVASDEACIPNADSIKGVTLAATLILLQDKVDNTNQGIEQGLATDEMPQNVQPEHAMQQNEIYDNIEQIQEVKTAKQVTQDRWFENLMPNERSQPAEVQHDIQTRRSHLRATQWYSQWENAQRKHKCMTPLNTKNTLSDRRKDCKKKKVIKRTKWVCGALVSF